MRLVQISQKTWFARHWFRWYTVERGGKDWQRLVIKPRGLAVKPKTIESIAESLKKAGK